MCRVFKKRIKTGMNALKLRQNLLKGQCHEIFCFRFFFLRDWKNNVRGISNLFCKFTEIFASQGAPTVSKTPTANFATPGTTGVIDAISKFAACVNNSVNKIAAGVNGSY